MGAPPRAPQPPPTQTSIQFMLDENCQLIQSIIDHHQQGKLNDAVPFQQRLHKNLVYLATVADSQGSGAIAGAMAGVPRGGPHVPNYRPQGPPGQVPPGKIRPGQPGQIPTSQAPAGQMQPGQAPGTP